MGKFIDLTGQRFGRLTVIERDTSRPKGIGAFWLCRCDCGGTKSVLTKNLHNGKVTSCGCRQHEAKSKTHGLSRTKIYKVWCDMRARCYDPKKERYPNYGGRGIKVCDEWRGSFQAFYDYVSKLEYFGEDGYTLDRINNNGNYEPDNVRWATDYEQRRNRTDNHFIDTGNGKKMILSDVARVAGVTNETIYKRLKLGATPEQLMSKERITARRVEVNGELFTIRQLAQMAGVHKSTISNRIKSGLTGADLLAPAKK